jgi:hypothetical protein
VKDLSDFEQEMLRLDRKIAPFECVYSIPLKFFSHFQECLIDTLHDGFPQAGIVHSWECPFSVSQLHPNRF